MLTWRIAGVEDSVRDLWKRAAYATRYGRSGLGEALAMDGASLDDFLEAVGEIIEEENKANRV